MLVQAYSQVWSAFTTIGAFLVALSVIVFVHELGHFLVARWCGVTVKAFSIGFGKEIWARVDKHGTRWRLAWLPLGGYVKFMDDENGASMPSKEALEAMSEEERKGAFHLKPLWQRAAVVAAGPIANFILAIAVFGTFFAIFGETQHVPRIDHVVPGSPAAAAGFKPGDVVKRINGRDIVGFEEIQLAERANAGEPVEFVVLRDGREVAIKAVPEARQETILGRATRVGQLGLEWTLQPKIGLVQPKSPADAAGVKVGDRIVAIDGKPITRFAELQTIVGGAIMADGRPIAEVKDLSTLRSPPVGRPLRLTIERDGQRIDLTVTPEAVAQRPAAGGFSFLVNLFGGGKSRDPEFRVPHFGRLGIGAAPPPLEDYVSHRYGPLESLVKATAKCQELVVQTISSLGRMFRGRESLDQVGGPIAIAVMSGEVWRSGGLLKMIEWIAFLSVSIGLINLFPIPVLDGGHLVMYAIEAVRRRPLSEKVQEYAFRVGLALILMLMIFVTWNDVIRNFFAGKS